MMIQPKDYRRRLFKATFSLLLFFGIVTFQLLTWASIVFFKSGARRLVPNDEMANDLMMMKKSYKDYTSTASHNDDDGETTIVSRIPAHPNERIRRRPFFVIHAGPSKTATTAIQQDSARKLQSQYLWEGDHAIYLGRWNNNTYTRRFHKFHKCLQEIYTANNQTLVLSKQEADQSCWNQFMLRNDGGIFHIGRNIDTTDNVDKPNLVFSEEQLSYSASTPEKFLSLLHYFQNTNHYDVVVVLTYRRYAEWLFSTILERYKKECIPSVGYYDKRLDVEIWPARNVSDDDSIRKKHTKKRRLNNDRPATANRCREPLFFARKLVKTSHYNVNYYQNLDTMIRQWRRFGFQVRVMNYHHSQQYQSAITENFYCHVLKEYTPSTCQGAIRNRLLLLSSNKTTNAVTKKTRHANKGSFAFLYDTIVVAVADRGWIDTTAVSRVQARTELIEHHTKVLHKSYVDLPLKCPPPQFYNQLLKKSLAFERLLVRDLYPGMSIKDLEQIERGHTQEVLKLEREKKAYCAVDLDLLLQDVMSYEDLLSRGLNRTWVS